MPVVLRPYLVMGLVLAASPGVAGLAPAAAPASAVDRTVALTSGADSLLNVPLNLVQDVVNIPYNEVNALTVLAQSLLFTGPWFVGSPTNVWGEDPGDPGHFESIIDLLVPFPQLSGIEATGDYSYPGLGQELSMLAAVEIPANPSCESLDCLPRVPTSPITGITSIDRLLWDVLTVTGAQKIPLIQSWFQVPASGVTDGNGYTFDIVIKDPTTGQYEVNPGLVDSGPVDSGYLWPGTHTPTAEEIADAAQLGVTLSPDTNLMPWAGETFTLDLAAPFQNFLTSLTAPFDPNGFRLPDLTDLLRALQTVAAGALLDFSPIVHGSPFCQGTCELPDGNQTYEGIISAISSIWPGNTYLDQWMSMYTANDGSLGYRSPQAEDLSSYLTWLWQHQKTFFDFNDGLPAPYGNEPPTDPSTADTGSYSPYLDPGGSRPALIVDAGYLPTMAEASAWVGQNLGPWWQAFFDNSGVLGPFNSTVISDLITDPSDLTAVNAIDAAAGLDVPVGLDAA